tara:strand:+ start:338 stop:703 length:366 start_codon:yes stop_codon:yes gene_type:complete
MSDYNWCHNPDCHTYETASRIRGVGNNKVLRTRRIMVSGYWRKDSIWSYFCNQKCLFNFLNTFRTQVRNIKPVNEPSETPITVEKEKYQSYRYQYVNGQSSRVPYTSTRTNILTVQHNKGG